MTSRTGRLDAVQRAEDTLRNPGKAHARIPERSHNRPQACKAADSNSRRDLVEKSDECTFVPFPGENKHRRELCSFGYSESPRKPVPQGLHGRRKPTFPANPGLPAPSPACEIGPRVSDGSSGCGEGNHAGASRGGGGGRLGTCTDIHTPVWMVVSAHVGEHSCAATGGKQPEKEGLYSLNSLCPGRATVRSCCL